MRQCIRSGPKAAQWALLLFAVLALAGCRTPGEAIHSTARLRQALHPLSPPAVIVSAHRGAPAPGRSENGLWALREAARGGAQIVECDVRATADGTLVLLHDSTLDRTTTGSGPIARTRDAELVRLRLRTADGRPTSERVPFLCQALGWARMGVLLALDVKDGVQASAVVRAVRLAGVQGCVVIIADDLQDLRRWAELAPDLCYSATARDTQEAAELIDLARGVCCPLAYTGRGPPRDEVREQLQAAGIRPLFLETPGDPWPPGSVVVRDDVRSAQAPPGR